MIRSCSQFSKLKKISNISSILLAIGSSSVLGLGDPIPSPSFKLNFVLYVLKFAINLLYVIHSLSNLILLLVFSFLLEHDIHYGSKS